MRNKSVLFTVLVLLTLGAFPNDRQHKRQEEQAAYALLTRSDIERDMKRVLDYLQEAIPSSASTKNVEAGLSTEVGTIFNALFTAYDQTHDSLYLDFVTRRLEILANQLPHLKETYESTGVVDEMVARFMEPRQVDDFGTLGAALIRGQMRYRDLVLSPWIDQGVNAMMFRFDRLWDETIVRNCPFLHTVCAEDVFKCVPTIALMGQYSPYEREKYYHKASRIMDGFINHLFVPEKALFRHAWVEEMADHISYYWGYGNGMAAWSLCEMLDVLPENHSSRTQFLQILRNHLHSIVAFQNKDGSWNRLIDRMDSGADASTTAMYVYIIAHVAAKGWIDAAAFGPAAWVGWQFLATRLASDGRLKQACGAAGVGFDVVHYYNVPYEEQSLAPYGPFIAAGAAMLQLMSQTYPGVNDGAICFYGTPQRTDLAMYPYSQPHNPLQFVAGISRKSPTMPVVFVIGDSTVKYHSDRGEADRWGWGSLIKGYFDSCRISVENCAMEGTSSRTYYNLGLWARLIPAMKSGDYLVIDFGHNDNGPIATGLSRGTLPGIGTESQTVVLEHDGSKETVRTYGYYIRRYIRQAKAKGVHVVLLSHTPANRWKNGKMIRCSDTYSKWNRELAEQEDVCFIDLNDAIAKEYEELGEKKTQDCFKDAVHTSRQGAEIHARALINAIRMAECCGLKNYLVSHQGDAASDVPSKG